MIYQKVKKTHPIRQGDIFYPLPLTTVELDNLYPVNSKQELEKQKWEDIMEIGNLAITVPVIPVWGIVASQDCDTLRTPYISFFRISRIADIYKGSPPKSEEGWLNIVLKNAKSSPKWFYLPPDQSVGFNERMAVNFMEVFLIEREPLLKKASKLRKGRLNDVADEHFRESIAQYFRRYPYDEWYPLNKKELETYKNKYGEIKPYKWQK